jgi:hypothetical protein
VKKALNLLSGIFLLALLSCGEPTTGEPDWAADVPHLTITAVDSICMEPGDSSFSFGLISDAAQSPEGSIAVLDSEEGAVLLFSADGSFLGRISNPGSGPDEALHPSAIAFYNDGSMAVSDAEGCRIDFFDAAGSYSGCIDGFSPTAPLGITALDDGAIVGLNLEIAQSLVDQSTLLILNLARWQDSPWSTVEYCNESVPAEDLVASVMDAMFAFTASRTSGRVFRSPLSESYAVECYEPDGTLYLTIERPYNPASKTQAEIDEERTLMAAGLAAQGNSGALGMWEPDPYKNAIADLGVDGQDRLWVRRGWIDAPTFDVFDQAGTLLFVATVEYDAEVARLWSVQVDDGGLIAYNGFPVESPRLYMLRLQE